MFTIDKNEYRNLQEQVLKNKQDIAAHYAIDRVLAEFGIRVIGVVASSDDLDENYQGEYGDAFAVGTEPPYTFWIWTRPDPAAGHDTAYWFDVGELAIVGPQGVPGPKGDKGDTGASTRWFVISNYTDLTQEPYRSMAPGNIAIIDGFTWETGEYSGLHGQTYIKETSAWIAGPNLRGPQGLTGNTGAPGAKGDKGDKGDTGAPGPAGPIVVIKGIITSLSQLDTVIPTAPNDAYLLERDGNKYIVGLVDGDWTELGLFAGGTLVTKNGLIQNEWNADTKLDKNTESGARRVYGISAQGQPTYPTLDYRNNGGAYQIVVRRDTTGNIIIPETPTQNTDAASKKYVDDKSKLYEHSIYMTGGQSGDSFEIFEKHYNHSAAQETSVNTNGRNVASGYVSISLDICPIICADINTGSSGVTVTYMHMGNVETTSFDSGSWTVVDRVREV